ncbi:MAG: DUF2834 domain-containing protein [Chloroflexota bacterium]
MNVKHIYIILCILGTVLPYSQFLPWLLENGLNIPLLFNEIATSRVAAFGWLDVIVSAVVLFVFMWEDGRSRKVSNLWLPIVGTLTVGVSLGLPLYLLLRELDKEKRSDG